MAKFKKKTLLRSVEIPTSALPDIIFMLLFFFMVTTVLKENDEKVRYMIPAAEQLKKIEKKRLVSEIIIGFPKQKELFGTEPVVQGDGRILELKNITQFVEERKSELPELERDQHIILLKVDKNVEMGIVTDLQQELRKANARKIVYSTLKNEKE